MSCASSTFVIRQGDRQPDLRLPVAVGCCEDDFDGDAYSGWTLLLVGPTTISGAMTFDETTMTATYAWAAGSTAVPGAYVALVQATHTASGTTRTFPASGGTEVVIAALPS